MSLEIFIFLASVHALALISPGPDFAIVTRLSIVSGRRTGFLAACGVSSAIGVYVLICIFGLSVIINALPNLSSILSFIGAIYLAWLGIQCIRSKDNSPKQAQTNMEEKPLLQGFLPIS